MTASNMVCVVVLILIGLVVQGKSQSYPHCPQRQTVMVWGDPHMLIYRSPFYAFCEAKGWRTYMLNDFYELRGSTNSFFYVNEVQLTFFCEDDNLVYTSGTGSISKTFVGGSTTSPSGNIELHDLGSRVQIIDYHSSTAFLFEKWRATYYFTVRTGTCVLDRSCGLMISGCPCTPSPAVAGVNVHKPQLSRCQLACEIIADDIMRRSCEDDCMLTGDTGVVALSFEVMQMERDIVQLDDLFINSNATILESENMEM